MPSCTRRSSCTPRGAIRTRGSRRRRAPRRVERGNMLGAIAGDIIGSAYEHRPLKSKDFVLFHPRARYTDDSVLTIAVAAAILGDGDYRRAMHELGPRYPDAGYAAAFLQRLAPADPAPV